MSCADAQLWSRRGIMLRLSSMTARRSCPMSRLVDASMELLLSKPPGQDVEAQVRRLRQALGEYALLTRGYAETRREIDELFGEIDLDFDF